MSNRVPNEKFYRLTLALDLKKGDSQRLRFSYDPSETWFSHDNKTATVDSLGVVSAVDEGLAPIEVSLNGETGFIYVRVR